jgi:hypothetical protein
MQPSTRFCLESDESNHHTTHSFGAHYISSIYALFSKLCFLSGFTATVFYKFLIPRALFMSFPSSIHKYVLIILYFSHNYLNIYMMQCNKIGASLSKNKAQITKVARPLLHCTVSSYTLSCCVANRGMILL